MATLNRASNGEFYAGQLHAKMVDLVGPASYATGGVPINGNDVGVGHTVLGATFIGFSAQASTVVYGAVWDSTNQKLILTDNAGAQVGNGQDLSAGTYRILFRSFACAISIGRPSRIG